MRWIFYLFLPACVPFLRSPPDLYREAEEKGDTLTMKKLAPVIKEKYPTSREGYELIGEEFYDSLYPVWKDKKAWIPVLERFLSRYPRTLWRDKAYLYLMHAFDETGDTAGLFEYGRRWISEKRNSPLPHYILSVYLYKHRRFEEGYKESMIACSLSTGKRPQNYPSIQWWMDSLSLEVNKRLYLSLFLIERKEYGKADSVIEEALKIEFGPDHYGTHAGLYFAKARIFLEKGDTASAKRYLSLALVEGDMRGTWTFKADSLMRLLSPNPIEEARRILNYTGMRFMDVTEKMGLSGVKGGVVALGDMDGDGFDDLVVSGIRIFKNVKGKEFIDVTEELGFSGVKGKGMCLDVDGDGDQDLFVFGKKERLFINEGGRFQEVSFPPDTFPTEGCGAFDLDGDGDLEIYLANYENWNRHVYFRDRLFLNTDSGWVEIPLDIPERAGRSVTVCDYDMDGDVDVYVSNYRLQENFFFVNEHGKLIEKAEEMGVAGREVDGWWGHTIGSDFGDVDGDGDFDLITANLAHPRYIEFSNMTMVYINEDGRFMDRRKELGIKYEETHSFPLLWDFDGDGDLDLYITSIYPKRRSFLYENRNGKFYDVTYPAGVRVYNSWGVACGDLDRDGDPDLVVGSSEGVRVFKNESKARWLRVEGMLPGEVIKVHLRSGKTLIRHVKNFSSPSLSIGIPEEIVRVEM